MRNLMILGTIGLGLTLIGCGDKDADTAVEEEVVEDTSAEESEEGGEEAESEEAE